MNASFTFEQLKKLQSQGYGRAPVYIATFADAATPIQCLSAVKERYGRCFLFESIEGGEKIARYSFIGFDPVATLSLKDGVLTVERKGEKVSRNTSDPNAEIRRELGRCAMPRTEGLPPFTGGFVGYFSYEYYKYYERAEFLPSGNFGDCKLMLFDKVIAYDNFSQKIYVIINLPLSGLTREGYEEALSVLGGMLSLVERGGRQVSEKLSQLSPFEMRFGKEEYEKKVEEAKAHVREGDIFQCVPSNIWRGQFEGSLLNSYRILRTTNPSPYMIYLNMDGCEIAGASPETLVKLKKGIVSTFPIAGSRPRGKTDEEDAALERELLADEKEISEHNMLVDLGRNDLGKICRFGTVKVEDYKKIYRFSHVMHITSCVTGKAEEGKDVLDALSATLPAGTLSGAPKRRAMEIISVLEEGETRGVYGGAVGYVSFDGDGDFCIAIRTATKRGNEVTVRAGGGIVADSKPESEFTETVNKSAAMREAIIKSCGV